MRGIWKVLSMVQIFSDRLTKPFMFGIILNSYLCSLLWNKFEVESAWHTFLRQVFPWWWVKVSTYIYNKQTYIFFSNLGSYLAVSAGWYSLCSVWQITLQPGVVERLVNRHSVSVVNREKNNNLISVSKDLDYCLNESGKKMQGFAKQTILNHNEFNKFSNTWAGMQDYTCHIIWQTTTCMVHL